MMVFFAFEKVERFSVIKVQGDFVVGDGIAMLTKRL